MSEATAELAFRLRPSDPKPAHCSGCLCSSGPDVTFIDFDAMVDRGSFVDPNGAMHVVDGMEELHLCEACVRQAAEVLAYKPELHRRQLTEIKRLEVERDHWRATAQRFKREADQQFDANFGAEKPRRRG